MSKPRRLIGLDFVRGVAALLVVIQHSFEATGYAKGWLDPFHGVGNLGQAGVVAFFLVSGYVIPMSLERTESQRGFWISRAFRIYPMYTFSFISTVAFMGGSFDFKTVLAHIGFIQEFVPGVVDQVPNSWTLSLELTWYIGTAILFSFGLLSRSYFIFFITMFFSILVGIMTWHTAEIPAGRFLLLVSCVIGLLLYRKANASQPEILWLVLALVIMVFVILLIAFRIEGGLPRDDFSPWTIFVAWAVGYLIFFTGLNVADRLPCHVLLAWLGKISFSAYLIHPFIIALALSLEISGVGIILFVILATVGLSAVTYRYIEVPAIRYGRSHLNS